MKNFLLFFFLFTFSFFLFRNDVFAAYCPDTQCDTVGVIGPAEDCNSCPQDCGACPIPGYVQCGGGTCGSGLSYTTWCSPSCGAIPRTCYDTPSCDWGTNCKDPATCNMSGYGPVEGGCCPPPHCVGPVGCGKTICASGGNCYSDCSACTGPTPTPGGPVPTEPPPPPVCVAPVTPTLKTPTNGAYVGTLSTTLTWNPIASWGNNPAGNINTYEVYVNACGAPCTPTSLLGSTNSSTTSYNVAGLVKNTTYYWMVRSNNGCMFKDSEIWNFYVPNISWIQGFKRLMPLNINDPIVNGQTVTLDPGTPGVLSKTINSYWFNPVSQGNHTVSVSVPAGYSVISTLCYNIIGCHTPACVAGKKSCPYTGSPLAPDPRGCDDSCTGAVVSESGNSRTINAPYGYTDLWFHYTPLTCTISLSPATQNIPQGGGRSVVDIVTISDGSSPDTVVSNLAFSSVNTAIATINPSSKVFPPATYSTTATGVTLGSTYIRSTVTLVNGNTCSCCIAGVDAGCLATTCAQVTVVPADPWFQTKGGDVHAQNEIDSPISGAMSSTYFNLDLDTYPGLISYGDFILGAYFGAGRVSSKGWLTQSSFSSDKTSYNYFYQKLLSPTIDNFSCSDIDSTCPTPPAGTTIYYSTNDVSISGTDSWSIPSTSKVIVLIEGDLDISLNTDREITVSEGGFLAFIVNGDIRIGGQASVEGEITTNLQGIYIADGTIDTGDIDGLRFVGEGLFYADNVTLDRDLGSDNAYTPAELFIFRPDLVVNAPYDLWTSKVDWQEVAP